VRSISDLTRTEKCLFYWLWKNENPAMQKQQSHALGRTMSYIASETKIEWDAQHLSALRALGIN
jgi:hypothetical protein